MDKLHPREALARVHPLISLGQPLIFHKDQVLSYAGHVPYGVFVVRSGHVAFRGASPCPREHIHRSPEGLVIGLEDVLAGEPSCCSTVAEDDCRVIFISKTLLAGLAHA